MDTTRNQADATMVRRADVRSMAAALPWLPAQAHAPHIDHRPSTIDRWRMADGRQQMTDTGCATAVVDPAHRDAHAPVQPPLAWLQALRHRQTWTCVLGRFKYASFLPTRRVSPPCAVRVHLHAGQLR
ncbi:hypothetical protein FHY12_003860 [Xanthomonas arboricola]|uniref:hypothetical protein n=1 Tax=Xanthomonas euroxanthea TaxID=2259622 RepID=UPI00141BCC35|nr:hypothetical protein [Xanthomonas euroxanthea]NIK41485.1 hypothetical protein [Xanthomonas euroxanthea]